MNGHNLLIKRREIDLRLDLMLLAYVKKAFNLFSICFFLKSNINYDLSFFSSSLILIIFSRYVRKVPYNRSLTCLYLRCNIAY